MPEYIEREAAIDAAFGAMADGRAIFPALNNLQAADVRPVVRGKWEWDKNNGFYYCSKCGAISPREDQDGEYCDCPNYCPNCGADMKDTNDEKA